MITILSVTKVITRDDCFKHIEFPFVVDKEYRKLVVFYDYSPKDYDGSDAYEMALNAFKEAYGKYSFNEEEIKNELPLKNHVTISISKDDKLIGTAHRHANALTMEIGGEFATEGCHKTKIIPGNYSVVLSAHAVLSEKIVANVRVVAYE